MIKIAKSGSLMVGTDVLERKERDFESNSDFGNGFIGAVFMFYSN
jgi:hypothetical protein